MTNNKNWQKIKIERARSHQTKIFQNLNNLVVASRKGRNIVIEGTGEHLIEFASCSYFDLDQDVRLLEALNNNASKFGVNFAVARTRLRTQNHIILESLLSKIFCNASITLFSSLHLTHLGFLPLLSSGELPSFKIKEKGVFFIMDKAAHNCFQVERGLLNQFGETVFIDFQNKNELAKAFSHANLTLRTPITLSDSICSMGKAVPVTFMFELATKYEGYVYLDDAHGTSLYGTYGCGYVLNELNEVFHPRLILTPSLSKAFGSNMAVLALPTKADMDMVRRFDSAYLFSNPPGNALIESAIISANIHLSNEIQNLQHKLWDNVSLFDKNIKIQTINHNEQLPIRCVVINDENKAIACAIHLREQGFFVNAAMYPTVVLNNAIIRIALSVQHSPSDIRRLCNTINRFLDI